MLCSTALSRVSVTEHWRKKHGEESTVCHDLIHFCSGRRNALLVLLLGRIRSLFKQVWKKLCTLQVFLMLQLCLPLLKIYSTQKADRQEHIVMVYANTLGTWHCGIYSDSFEHGFWWTEFAFTCEARFVRIAFYECVDKVLCWAKARVATSRRYLWPGYWR